MDDSIAKRAKLSRDEEEIHQRSIVPPRIIIRNYSSLIALDLVQAPAGAPHGGGGDVFLLTFQNGLTKQLSQLEYDVVICATGYDRSSWTQLLRRSELGKHFIRGDSSSNGLVHILPDHAQGGDLHALSPSGSDTVEVPGVAENLTPPLSSVSTPFTSSGSSSPILGRYSGCRDTIRDSSSRVHVSRAYRLVPKDPGVEPLPRVYVQGCTESTHGLSDTLLSVVSLRAGEIVADLMEA